MKNIKNSSVCRRGWTVWNFVSVMVLICATGIFSAANGADQADSAARKRTKPNLIFIMVDDMGKDPVGCYGDGAAESLTPRIDKLAAGGMRLNNFYSMPQCTPSRVALLTSQYPYRNGWVNHYDVPRWNLKGFSPKVYPSIGNVLKSAGYATCIAGKWQISDFRREPNILRECGFDQFCVWTGAESGNPPSNRRYWDAYLHTDDGSKTYSGKFGPDVCNDFLLQFVRDHRDKPFFIYYPMILIHGPLEETPLQRKGDGPSEDRQAAAADPLAKRTGKKDKKKKKNKRGKSPSIYYMDHLVGRLIDVLDETGVRDNTIVVWTTDNGPSKGKTAESGVCQPFVVNCPGVTPKGAVTDALVDITDILPTFAELSGAPAVDRSSIDGHSFAGLVTGRQKDSSRDWMLAMGGGACRRDSSRREPVPGYNAHEYRDRVVRDKHYKLYIDNDRQPVKLVKMHNGEESENLIDSDEASDKAALKKLSAVADGFPRKDASPKYAD